MAGMLGYIQNHSTVQVDGEILLWAGYQDAGEGRVSQEHDSSDMVPSRKRINVLNLSTLQWQKNDSTGDPPNGLMNYGSACIGNDVYFFGGRCDHRQSYSHNNLHFYNTVSKTWKTIPPCTETGPMEKYSCGFTALGDPQTCSYLIAFGGKGMKPPIPLPQHSSYIPFDNEFECFTNEIHVMDITNFLGDWFVPTITGQRPPPIAWFTMNALPSNIHQCVMFGGYIVTENGVGEWTNDIFIITLCKDTVSFEKISRPNLSQWPKCRDTYSSCIVTSGTCMCIGDDNSNLSHLCVMGGSDGRTINDCWMFSLNNKTWNKLPLPDLVCAREAHSIVNCKINFNTQWIVVVGGEVDYTEIQGDLVTIIIEIVYFPSLSQWIFKKLWNCTDKWTHSDQWLALQQDVYQEFMIKDTSSSPSNETKPPTKVYSLDDMRKKTSTNQDDIITMIHKDQNGTLSSNENNETSFTTDNEADRTCLKIGRNIKDVMDRNHASLSALFEDSIKEVSESMLSAGIIPRIKMKEPSSDVIINSFNYGLNFKTTIQEIENHCVKFLTVVQDFGGPFTDAALSIQTQIIEIVSNNLAIQLQLEL